jgi:hypothetical protein
MVFDDLPHRLDDLERRLTTRSFLSADAAYRDRVLSAVQEELHRQSPIPWLFVASAAAIFLLGVNLALSPSLDARLYESSEMDSSNWEQGARDREWIMTNLDATNDR